jgi:hypothetical protein
LDFGSGEPECARHGEQQLECVTASVSDLMTSGKQYGMKIELVCATVFFLIGTTIFQMQASQLFPTPAGGGMNLERVMWAAIVGGASSGIGYAIGKLIKKLTGK